MKIAEIITEGDVHANPKQLASDQVSSLKGALSLPGISGNKSNGSPYQQYRFMIATGLVDGKGTGETMPAAGAMAGDPLITCYTDEEFNMIKDAAEMTGAGSINQLSNQKSMESGEVHKVSPHRNPGAITRKK
jgi:hypothetical protein